MSQPILRSASLRVMLLVAGGIIALSVLAMGWQYRDTARSLQARQMALLAADMEAFASLYEQRRIVALREAIEYRAALTPADQALFLLQGKDGEVLAGNITDWPDGVTALAGTFGTDGMQVLALNDHTYLAVGRMLPGGFPLLVARGLDDVQATLAELRGRILATGGVLIALSLAAGWIVSRLVMRRIDRLNALADRVAEGDLSARLPGPRNDDEFGQLETHVHAMLDRIEALNRATHRLSDTIAHEMRTPLNRIVQKLSRIEGQDDTVDQLRAEMRGTIRIFDSLLDISAAEAKTGDRPGLKPVNLSELAEEVWELYDPVAEDKGLTFRSDIDPGLWVLGERNLIAQLISNLLDNAIKFTSAGDDVLLALSTDGARHVLRIKDTGPGVPADIHEDAFERFVRAERDREVAGHGLGLALVQAIATRHGAKVERPKVKKGFEIVIAWPKFDRPKAAGHGEND